MKEIIKYIGLAVGAILLAWVLTILGQFVGKPKIESWDDFVIIVKKSPQISIEFVTNNPVHAGFYTILISVGVVIASLLIRAYRRIRSQSELLSTAAIYKALVDQIGIVGRWPHARKDGTGAPWADLCAEIGKPANTILFVLGANGTETFADSTAPLHNVLSAFKGTIRVILADPASGLTKGRARALGVPEREYNRAIRESVRRLKTLKLQQHSIEGRYYSGQPNWKLIITENTVWVQYYTPGGQHVADTPVYRFDKGANGDGFYHLFYMEFDRIWRRCASSQMNLG